VKPSIGHIRDLPRAPPTSRLGEGEKWRASASTSTTLQTGLRVSSDRKKIVAELKAALKQVDELYLARRRPRGEAIAWHLQEVLNPKVPVKRMVFHEISPRHRQGVSETRDLDLRLVDAQEGRRFLDRLVGYESLRTLARGRQGPIGRPCPVGRDSTGV